MKKSFRTLIVSIFAGLVLAIGLNMITVGGGESGPDGYLLQKGFPFESCTKFVDLTQANPLRCSYGPVIGNVLIAFFVVFGIWGNVQFFRGVCKK